MFRFYSRRIDFLWLFERERLVMASTMETGRLMMMMGTRPEGLETYEVQDRRRTYGSNVVSLPLGRRQCRVGSMDAHELEDFLHYLSNRFVSVARKGGEPFTAVQSSRLVPGDIVLLKDGDLVPADIRIFETDGFQVDQHILTGMNAPVRKHSSLEKNSSAISSITGLSDICLAGTAVVDGKARGVVISTGPATYLGKIIYGY